MFYLSRKRLLVRMQIMEVKKLLSKNPSVEYKFTLAGIWFQKVSVTLSVLPAEVHHAHGEGSEEFCR